MCVMERERVYVCVCVRACVGPFFYAYTSLHMIAMNMVIDNLNFPETKSGYRRQELWEEAEEIKSRT